MTELFAGLCFCDLESNDSGSYSMAFNAGRLVCALILMIVMGAIGWFTFPF